MAELTDAEVFGKAAPAAPRELTDAEVFSAPQAPPPSAPGVDSQNPGFDRTDPRFGGAGMAGAKFLEGVPIAGAGVSHLAAALSAAAQPVTGVGDPGETFGERFTKNLAAEQAASRAADTEHPIESAVAGLMGGTAALAPLGATALGAKALGMIPGGLAAKTAAGAASGAGINAVDAIARGNDPTNAAAIGGVIGGAVPGAGRLAGAIASPLVNTVRGILDPAGEAARRVGGSIARDVQAGGAGLHPIEFMDATREGAPVAAIDLGGETTRALARSAANTSPEGREILNKAIDNRFESQSTRLTNWLRSTFNYPDAVSQEAALSQVQKTVNNKSYGKAMQEGADGIWSPELERLAGSDAVTSAMQGAMKTAKDEAVVKGAGAFNPKFTFTPDGRLETRAGPSGVPTYPDLEFWDLTRRNLSDSASAARRAGRMDEARRYGLLAEQMNTALDSQVPSYKQARQGAAAFFGAHDALEAGQNFVTRNADNQEARLALAKMSPTERQLFQDGFVSDFMKQINNSPDRRSILSVIANSPSTREKLNIALGPQKSQQFEAMLHIESIMDHARRAVQGNSTTARQLTELGLAGGAGALSGGGNPFDPTSVMNAALVYGALRGRSAINSRVSKQVAELLTSNDPARMANAMRMVSKSPQLLEALRGADAALARTSASRISAPSQPQFPPPPPPAVPYQPAAGPQ